MSEEIINPQPKQTVFEIQLPDREKQWEKCPAYVTKTKIVRMQTTEVVDGVEKASVPVEQEVEYTEMATEGKGEAAQPIKLSDVAKKLTAAVDIQTAKPDPKTHSESEKASIAVADVLALNFADEKGKVDEKVLKAKASWGLGCPANCGGFREFSYAGMVPQSYKCDVCGVTIILV